MALPHLPNELIDQIMFFACAGDPHMQWLVIRHVSRYYRDMFEQDFKEHWLALVTITLYIGVEEQVGYLFDASATGHEDKTNRANFRTYWPSKLMSDCPHVVPGEWDGYQRCPTDRRTVHVRFGQRWIGAGRRGSHTVSDFRLPDLEVRPDGLAISVEWKTLITTLLTEDALMAKVACDMMYAHVDLLESQSLWPRTVRERCYLLLRYLHDHVRLARREALKEHRLRLLRRDSILGTLIIPVDYEAYPPDISGDPESERLWGPSITEVIYKEESMVPLLEPWLTGINSRELGGLYAEENRLICDDVDGQDRKRVWLHHGQRGWAEMFVEGVPRWHYWCREDSGRQTLSRGCWCKLPTYAGSPC